MEYFISDLHLFHEKCIGFDRRPFENVELMHEDIVKNWNEKVTNGDTVYILGDISMRGTNIELIKLVSTLKGHKVLIKGNHDQIKDYRYQQLFQEIVDYKEIQTVLPRENDPTRKESIGVVLSHYPILMWNNQHRGTIHLYGHVHNSVEETIVQDAIERINRGDYVTDVHPRREGEKQLRAYNVGCMMPWMAYTPRTLEEIVSRYMVFKRKNYRR
jgi:calcineurin-like phosphoesterase family protein